MSLKKQKSYSERLIMWFNDTYNTNIVFRRFIHYNIFIWISVIASFLTSIALSNIVHPAVSFALMLFFIMEIAYFLVIHGVKET